MKLQKFQQKRKTAIMAPSVQELPVDVPVVLVEKLASTEQVQEVKQEPKHELVQEEDPENQEKVAEVKEEIKTVTPRVKRQIDLEGGKTDAKVHSLDFASSTHLKPKHHSHKSTTNKNNSTLNTSQPGTSVKNTQISNPSPTSNMAKTPTQPSKTCSSKEAKSRS